MQVVRAEDSVLLSEGLVRLFDEAGATVVAAVGDGDSLVEAVVEHRPDIAVVDVRMPPSFTDEGLRAAIRARAVVPGLGVLVLSQYVEESYASDLLSEAGAPGAGGVGYLLKDRISKLDEFSDALRRVNDGGTVLDPEVVAGLFALRRRNDPVNELTPREREVLSLMAEGRTNTAIARALSVSGGAAERRSGGAAERRSGGAAERRSGGAAERRSGGEAHLLDLHQAHAAAVQRRPPPRPRRPGLAQGVVQCPGRAASPVIDTATVCGTRYRSAAGRSSHDGSVERHAVSTTGRLDPCRRAGSTGRLLRRSP